MSDSAERLWEVIEPYVAREGIELDDIEVVGQGGASIVRVTIDATEPVDVDRIARISRGVSRILDEEDPIQSAYTLEVSSPGLERKLRRPEHFAKSIGREAKVKVKGAEGFETVRGIITSVDETGFEMKVDDTERRLEFSDVTSASTVYVWQKNPRPGSKEGR